MDVLRKAFESLGFGSVATFLGSGDVVFETRTKHVGALEQEDRTRTQTSFRLHGASVDQDPGSVEGNRVYGTLRIQRPREQISMSFCLRTISIDGPR